MAIKQLETNLKVIQSGNVPTTTTLPEGCLSFGKIGGKPKIFGNSAGAIEEYGVSEKSVRTATLVVGFTDDCDYNIIALGTTNNAQTTINVAITALPTTGGKIILREGTYNITSNINMNKANVILEGMGRSTVLKRMANFTNGIVYATQVACNIEYINIDGNKSVYTSTTNHGISIANAQARIQNLYIYNNNGSGIMTGTAAYDCIYNNNNIYSNTSYGIYQQAGRTTISNNMFTDNMANAIYVNGNNTAYTAIIGNLCHSNHTGIAHNGNFGIVSSNICVSNTNYGMQVQSTRGVVVGNFCYANNMGLYLGGASGVMVAGNNCSNNTTWGISVGSTVRYAAIVGNQINDNTTGSISDAGVGTHIANNQTTTIGT